MDTVHLGINLTVVNSLEYDLGLVPLPPIPRAAALWVCTYVCVLPNPRVCLPIMRKDLDFVGLLDVINSC